jgi:diguanylate cyclase (GGDEF)-like protein
MQNTVELVQGIYWVGGSEQDGGLHCNPYLIIDGDEAVLIDPGSVLDFDYVYKHVTELVPLEKIKYVILHHQDPDFCSSVPLFEKMGANFTIVTHWRTSALVKYYGIISPYYIVNENNFQLKLESGRILGFVSTPYLHFPGAITTYDYHSKILFSSDLFGAFSYDWTLYADENYIDKMKTFHEHYMPSNDIIRPVMEVFLSMDIAMIAPQHGSIIKDRIAEHVRVLRDLECGFFLAPIQKNIAQSGGYIAVCNKVVKRYASIYSKNEVMEVIKDMEITISPEELEIVDYNYRGTELWNLLFDNVLAKKDMDWLVVIEPMVNSLCKEYDLPVPNVFHSTLMKAQNEAAILSRENEELREINLKLNSTVKETQDQLIKCPVTGLYNYTFFKSYLSNSIGELYSEEQAFNPTLILINVDNMAKIRYSYGDNEVDATLKNISYTLKDIVQENMMLFRLQGASFGCFIPSITKNKAIVFAEEIRNAINYSVKYIEKITVSIGLACSDELSEGVGQVTATDILLYDMALLRLKLAKRIGSNRVCSNSSAEDDKEGQGKILIVDTDEINIDVLKTILENLKYQVLIAEDGEEVLTISERELPSLIISEVMLPKLDIFQVRRILLTQSLTKNIPFIIVSHLKNEDSLKQAAALGIEHYLKKPYMLSELIGIVRNKVRGGFE